MYKFIIVFYTVEPKPPEIYRETSEDVQKFLERIVELTKHKAKFAIYKIGECCGDFS
jgi:hypothetical protein